MARAIRVDQTSAEHHVAAALAMDRACARKAAQTVEEARGGGDPPGMQFGIAARQPAGVAFLRGRFVGERREGNELGALRPPAGLDMRIDEAEGGVAGNGEALARRGQGRWGLARCRQRRRTGGGDDRIEIDGRCDRLRQRIKPGMQIGGFAGLHQPKMAIGQDQAGFARQGA